MTLPPLLVSGWNDAVTAGEEGCAGGGKELFLCLLFPSSHSFCSELQTKVGFSLVLLTMTAM